MKFFILFILIVKTLSACTILNQKTEKIVISEISIYSDFDDRGYTTAGAYTNFNDLESGGVEKMEISFSDKQEIEQIIQEAKKSKHHQTKYGGKLVFALVKFSEVDNISKVILSVGAESAFIIDLSNMIQYEITLPTDLLWLKDFRLKLEKK